MSQDAAAVIDAAQVVVGAIAARSRGDVEGARALLASCEDHAELAGGAFLVAELGLGLLSRATGETLDECAGSHGLELLGMPRP